MITYNKEELRDKIYACWMGKSIGGTLGAPYEWCQEILDVKGFTSEPGNPLPNDDLDLQLVWLYALETDGPWNMSPELLGEYWVAYVTPYWNEYGIGKANFKEGLIPPVSGEFNNAKWKTSNGAWIRSEIWACLAPGFPNVACKYAYMDAVVDHGLNEGTYAELFTATIESYAFFEKDLRKILNKGLSQIPDDCRVAKAVKLVIEEYDKGTDWKIVRNMLVKQSEDIGVFQAPANLGYVVIGLLYGEGDFKKSMLCTINCADDADCTAATIGSFMGIWLGSKGIPADWQEYIGDNIITACVNGHIVYKMPKTCTELTERTLNMLIPVLKANGIDAQFGETTDISGVKDIAPPEDFTNRPKYSYDVPIKPYSQVRVTLSKEPKLEIGEEMEVTLSFTNKMHAPKYLYFDYVVSHGLEISGQPKSIFSSNPEWDKFTFKIKATETLEAKNTINILVSAKEHNTVNVIPIVIFG